ncbi:kinesin-like protein KIF2A isoform X2 [Sycon ciliatum]|uniref:kinesin-like protein KIF2A isoform X2 n=1 Tax=Sycon ciliatum TaxID=27933 RepID=UPI0020AD6A9E|eukprot:scpid39923/ scgid19768/ Kinesin-like protein KIF2A
MSVSKLVTGESVKIQRSNGRVHFALVSNVNFDAQTVMVEWFEHGETKGKEVDFKQIFALNEDLRPTPEPSMPAPAPIPNAHSSPAAEKPPSKLQAPLRSSARNAAKSSRPSTAVSQISTPQASASRPSTSSGIPKRVNSPLAPRPQNVKETAETPSPPVKRSIPVPASAASKISKPKQPAVRHSIGGAQLQDAKKAKESGVGNRRRSHCVKEVERLKKNREERRARQAEQVQQRLEEIDPSNPNADFLMMIRDHVSGLRITSLSPRDQVSAQRITVCVRKRPLNRKELGRQEVDVLTVDARNHLYVHEPKLKVDLTKYLENHPFRFDYAFNEDAQNSLVYRFTAQPLVETIFDRGMATCFAYGQTGSGKTHTMGGHFTNNKEQDASDGIYALAAADVFRLHALPKNQAKDLVVSSSFFEIYGGKVFDLLNNKAKLRILEDGKQQVQVVGLTEQTVTCVDDVLRCIHLGNQIRTSGTTSANQHSSRSHAVFQLVLRKRTNKKLHGKFSLIDLAGNERGADTSSADRQTRMEGAEINKSLLALKECIRALGRKGAHLPFRASKLTLVLKDSFMGDRSRTCMIAMVSPGQNSCEHTLNTLRYADRVKELEAGSGGGAAGNGGDMPPPAAPLSPPPPQPMDDGEADDLRLVHQSLKEGEQLFSNDILHFHVAMSHLVEAQEQLVECHRGFNQAEFMRRSEQLLQHADSPDSDMEAYARHLEELLTEQEHHVAQLRAKVSSFRQQLHEEEMASQHVKKLPFP